SLTHSSLRSELRILRILSESSLFLIPLLFLNGLQTYLVFLNIPEVNLVFSK
ncbi:uncharacterized protein METZ01_LOCUS455585, partial [marine metagenome]